MDEEQEEQDRLAHEELIERNARLDAIRHIVSTSPGRSYFWRLLEDACVFSTTFSTEPYASAFNEGRRSLGLVILDDIQNAAPEKFLQMIEEASHGRSERVRTRPS